MAHAGRFAFVGNVSRQGHTSVNDGRGGKAGSVQINTIQSLCVCRLERNGGSEGSPALYGVCKRYVYHSCVFS